MDKYLHITDDGLYVKETMFKTVDIHMSGGNKNALKEVSDRVEKYEKFDYILVEATNPGEGIRGPRNCVYYGCRIVDKMWASKYTHETRDRLRFTYNRLSSDKNVWEAHMRDRKLENILS